VTDLAVHAFADEAQPAARLAEALGAPLALVDLHRFPDGEVMPTVSQTARTTVVYRSLDRPDEKLIALLLAADAWRRAGAERLILVAPYLCYLRQDAVFAPGQPLSRDVIGPLLGARFDRVLTVQAHLHRTADLSAVFGTPTRNLSAVPVLAPLFAESPGSLIVGPDAESAPWTGEWAGALGGEATTFAKVRHGDQAVTLTGVDRARVAGRRTILVDDVASSGATLAEATRHLLGAGAARVDIAVAHALFAPGAERALRDAGASRIVSTDSVAHPTNAAPLAAHLAQALKDELP
jgi:ribose-phosphate pyrophosphokinase